MSEFRGTVVKLVIASFSVTALLGIITLLAGDLGETTAKILLTTTIVGIASLTTLCYLAAAHHRWAPIGAFGAGVAVIPFAMSLYGTWADPDLDGYWKFFGVTLTLALSIAQACLLLAVAGRKRLSGLLMATLAVITAMAAFVIVLIVDDGWWDSSDTAVKVFGVLLILDVLGTVILASSALFKPKSPNAEAEPSVLTPAVESRLLDAAQRRGMSPSEFVASLLDDFIG